MINVLMTGAGAPGGPGIIKNLQRVGDINLFTADMDVSASGSYLHQNFTQIPPADDASFVDTLLDLARKKEIHVILPLVTKELERLSAAREIFTKNGIEIIVSEKETLNMLNDKGKFYTALNKYSIGCPKHAITCDTSLFLELVNEFNEKYGICVIKPCSGNGSRGIRIISDRFDRFELLFGEKPSSLHMSFDELKLTVEGRKIPKMIVSEYLPGPEVTVDTLSCKGDLQLVLIRERLKMSGGISTKGRFIKNEQITQLVETVANSIQGLHGPVGFQLKQDEYGVYQFLESNPRIQGTSVSSGGLGINFPELCIRIAQNEKINLNVRTSGIGFTRYFSEVYYDT